MAPARVDPTRTLGGPRTDPPHLAGPPNAPARDAAAGPGAAPAGRTSDVRFSDLERRLKAYLVALWRLRCPVRPRSATQAEPLRRTSFEGGIIRVPESFRGLAPPEATDLFRAALAHVAAHFRFTRARFPASSLKPVQIALVSLIEDARVEQLAIRAFPGLRHLWLRFHVAEPSGALTAPILFARLARALVDPAYRDDNGWVEKGRRLFFEQKARWEDQAISRVIGGLLGNDLGQMRVQFNARTYVVEPPYRDDNLGLWDLGDAASGAAAAEAIFESVRVEQTEDTQKPPDRERETPDEEPSAESPNRTTLVPAVDQESGVPVAHYPEWDYLIGRERPEHATIVEFPAPLGAAGAIDRTLERHEVLVNRITALIRSANVSRPERMRRRMEGERLDLDSCIRAAVAHRLGDTPDPRVYMTLERRYRDLSALVLLDVSQSTNDLVWRSTESILSLERAATALLARAMADLGDPFAIHAFCSNGREEVRYYRLKDFGAPFDQAARRRLAGLEGALSTRMGAAIRHAGADLARQRSHRRLLLVITDGEPSDVDVSDRRYLVEDARKAVMGLSHQGIDVFCVGLDSGGDSYLSRIFGRRNVLQIDRLHRLPEELPFLYLRLTA